MRVKFIPQRHDRSLTYEFNGDIINAHLDSEVDIFDFTSFTDGELDSVETTLVDGLVKSAKRVNGELYIELLYYFGQGAPDEQRLDELQQFTDVANLKWGVYNG